MKNGFTLAEVLITLGIIGIVAAMTLPALISNHKKNVTITRIKKFYTTFSQAVNLVRAEEDPAVFEELGALGVANVYNGEGVYNWYNTYMKKYFISKNITTYIDGIMVQNTDGSAFGIYGSHILFCVNAKVCKQKIENAGNYVSSVFINGMDGKEVFGFQISRDKFQTYQAAWNGERKNLLINSEPTASYGGNYGCAQVTRKYCAALLEYDGWKVSDDYPVKF